MRLPQALLTLFLSLSVFSTVVQASPTQQKLQELYSSKFVLSSKGVPIVTVGLMTGRKVASFSITSRAYVLLYRKNQSPFLLKLRPGRIYRVKITQSNAAKVRYWLSGFQTRYARSAAWKKAAAVWKKRGFSPKSLLVGSVFGIKGKIIDNRVRLGVLRSYSTYSQAQKEASRLSNRWNKHFHVYPELLSYPSFRLQLSYGSQKWFATSIMELRTIRGTTKLRRVEFGRGYKWHGFETRRYQGRLLFAPDKKGLLSVSNQIPIPQMLRGILPSEMPTSAPLEALKAQAICARNEMLSKIGTRHLGDPFLFCPHTHCQVYTGMKSVHPRTDQAIRATQGQILMSKSRLAKASYSAVCGGHSEHNENVWYTPRASELRGKLDLLRAFAPRYKRGITSKNIQQWLFSSPSAYCKGTTRRTRKYFRWTRKISASRLNQLVNRKLVVGRVYKISVEKRGISGRAHVIRLYGRRWINGGWVKTSLKVYRELTIRKLFGGLPSSMFIVQARYASPTRPVYWLFRGGGWGHGVGLCQRGAMGRARSGYNYKDILQHYFSGAKLLKVY